MTIGAALVRRGLDAHAYATEKNFKLNLPPWAIAIVAVTAVVYVFVLFMVEYTFGRIVPTLIMIESPQDDTVFEPLPTEDTDDTINKDPEPTGVPLRYLTSSFRSSLKLLDSKGGFRARFRGISMFLVNMVALQWVAAFLQAVTRGFIPMFFLNPIAMILCAQLSLGWVFIVISEPSPKPWFRRIPTIKLWKKVAGPTALYAVAAHVAAGIPLLVAGAIGLGDDASDIADKPASQQTVFVVKTFAVVALGLALALLFVLPATIALTRVQASLLSDDQETIVPFDRTFGGKVVPEIVGGSGMVGLLDAWNTFDWTARVRLLKAYIKVIFLVFAVSIFFSTVLAVQCVLFGGKKVFVPVDGNN